MKVLVLAARGLQAGYVGCYGNSWIATPNLDALAAEGVVFDQHFADRADAAGARLTWRDGRHHLPDPSHPDPQSDKYADLIAELRERGVYTCLIADDARAERPDFETGWDKVQRAPSYDRVLEAADAAMGRLAKRASWLLWVDLAVLLPPWDTPEEFLAPYFEDEPTEDEEEEEETEVEAEVEEPLTPLNDPPLGPVDPADETLFLRLQSSYAGAVTRLDAGVGRLLERLLALNPDDDVLIVCTADCGLALAEHGVVGLVPATAHEETTHLPLILRLPGADEAGRRVAALTQAVDLAPTLADVLEVQLQSAHGHNLLPLVYGEMEEIRPYACSGMQSGETVEWSLRTLKWALLIAVRRQSDDPVRGAQLYVKPDDRWEATDVLQHHQELAEGLERTLRGFVVATQKTGALEYPAFPDMEPGAKQSPV